MLLVRVAVLSDIDVLFEIRTSVRENHLSMEELTHLGITAQTLPAMLSGAGRGWVAEQAGSVIAFAMADSMEATVFAMFVRPEWEGKGAGRQLMQEAEQWLFAQGCEEVWLSTDSDLAVRANGFYRHLGWKDEGRQEDGQTRFTKRRPCA
ncbi:GNAT family N-acetyltransferase [Chitinimonas sp. BJB300]|nr:GNAT family N-acetyltransferase [Chitinimonas sp. BJB300]TSJ91630.1 GNAT family N-acetyltransferase [Chitinimonas sp. BJB300]